MTGVFRRVVADAGGLKMSSFFVVMMLGKSGWMLGGAGSSGEGGLITAALIKLAMTISTVKSCSGVGRDGWWSSSIASRDTESSGDSVVVSEYDPRAMALATSRSMDES